MRRPINPVIPYPNEAIQHTRCVLALSMITVAISFLKPEMLAQLGDLGKQVEKVNRWIDRCADDTQKRRLSGCPVPYPCRARWGCSGRCRRRHPLDAMGRRDVGRADLP